MNRITYLSSLDRPELAVYTKLTQAQLRSRLEPEKGIFIAESPNVIRLALDGGYQPVSFLMEEKHIENQAAPLLARCPGVPVYTGSRALLAELTGYELTRGILCAMKRPQPKAVEDICRSAARVAVLSGIVDSTNVGALFRSAAALGMDGVLVTPDCCDPLCRRAVRVSMGTVFQVPWGILPDMETLHDLGFATAAMALREDTLSVDDPRLAKEPRLAIVLGNEGHGLPQETIGACRYTVKIPMSHGVDSLNVAAAGAVAFWQLGKKEK